MQRDSVDISVNEVSHVHGHAVVEISKFLGQIQVITCKTCHSQRGGRRSWESVGGILFATRVRRRYVRALSNLTNTTFSHARRCVGVGVGGGGGGGGALNFQTA